VEADQPPQRLPVGRLALGLFQQRQHFCCARGHRLGQAGELAHLDAVRAVGRAGRDLMQEDDIVLPFLHPHGGAGDIVELFAERNQLVIMGREEGARFVHAVQMLDDRPGNG